MSIKRILSKQLHTNENENDCTCIKPCIKEHKKKINHDASPKKIKMYKSDLNKKDVYIMPNIMPKQIKEMPMSEDEDIHKENINYCTTVKKKTTKRQAKQESDDNVSIENTDNSKRPKLDKRRNKCKFKSFILDKSMWGTFFLYYLNNPFMPKKKLHPLCEAILMIIHITQAKLLYNQYNWDDMKIIVNEQATLPFFLSLTNDNGIQKLFRRKLKKKQLELLIAKTNENIENLRMEYINLECKHTYHPMIKLPDSISKLQKMMASITQNLCVVELDGNNQTVIKQFGVK